MERATLQRGSGSHTCGTTPREKGFIHSNCQGSSATLSPFQTSPVFTYPPQQASTSSTSIPNHQLHLYSPPPWQHSLLYPVCRTILLFVSSPTNPWKWGSCFFLYCPRSSPLAQPAIHSLILNLRRFDLWAWTTYTDTQNVNMLLGSIPPKLDRQHDSEGMLSQ